MTISATTQGLRMGVATSTSRPAVPFDGQVISETDTDSLQVYKGSAWAPVSGLTLISATTIGTTVSSVTVSSAFSATYDNYKIIVSDGANSSDNQSIELKLGTTTTGYYAAYTGVTYSTVAAILAADNNGTSFTRPGAAKTNGLFLNVDLVSPFLAKNTFFNGGAIIINVNSRVSAGYLNDTTSYTDFTLTPGAGTMTGGTICVYGYAKA